MKLNCWEKPTKYVCDVGKGFEEAEILEAHRFIYLFFDPLDIENHEKGDIVNGNSIIGKAIQVNLSISKGGKNNLDLLPWIRGSDNSTYMTIGMYVYDTLFDTDITNIASAQFTLLNSMVSSTTNDYDLKKAMTNGVNVYSKDLRDKPDKKEKIASTLTQGAPNIPEPMYYTMRQQEAEEDDCYCLTALSSSVVHNGAELLDDFTRISVMNVSLMDTLEPQIREKLYEIRNSVRRSDYNVNMYDSTELSDWLLYQDFESMQSGYTYIYDTNMGVNIIKTGKAFIPFREYQFNDKMVNDLNRTLDVIKSHAKQVEKQFGNVRMTFTPLLFGDRNDVYFRDYNDDNQPLLKNEVNIDNGTKVQNEITERVSMNDEDSFEFDMTPEDY